ncbi:MAG: shikimate dehydrogenase [Clostridium sp.]|nr:shikimate dehydrogenase [Clostridium sp.]
MISGRTNYYAILGNPIEQALSPIIQNAAFEAQGRDAVFLGCRVEPGKLEQAVQGSRALNFSGLAVTMPFKREIIPYLDWISPKAKALDAVNVVAVEDGRYCGYNTDGDGFVRDLAARGVPLEGRAVLLLGAGGAGRGIALSLLEAGVKKLYICNLYEDEARGVMEMLSVCGYGGAEYVPFEPEAVGAVCENVCLIANTTCLGMGERPSPHVDLIPWEEIDRETVFADIVHKPLKTQLLRTAEERGHRIVTGDGMLLYQGILAYRLLTGGEAPERSMREKLDQWLAMEQGG